MPLIISFLDSLDKQQRYGLYFSAALAFIGYKLATATPAAKVPAVGTTLPGFSYLNAWAFLRDSSSMLSKGYSAHRWKPFKVAWLDQWVVIVSGPKLIDELCRAPDDELSFPAAITDLLQANYTLGPQISANPYHLNVIRTQLTRSLVTCFPDMLDEVTVACDEEIKVSGSEWTKVVALKAVMQIVSRASGRVFVGLPLCRIPEYLDINVRFAIDVTLAGVIINLFPRFLRPIVGRYLTNVRKTTKQALKYLGPLIDERRAMSKEDRPSDLVTWLMDEATGIEETNEYLVMRILTVNFAGIHTSSMSFTHALFHLAASPEKYMQPLREEIESVLREYGWTKIAMGKMRKLDSFMKESQRIFGLGSTSLNRKALKDYTFADGTFIPKDTLILAAAGSMHTDPEFYGPNAGEFDGFRFAELREEENEGAKHQMVSTSPEYLAFGHGKHSCPGRFFASNEIKCMMAHMIMNYDIKFENEGVRPPDMWFGINCTPNRKAEVMFRRRQYT